MDIHTMAGTIDRSDDGSDYVSMHHRIRRDLKKRLKHLSADRDKPVTDMVNEAIMAYLDRVERTEADLNKLHGPDLVRALREMKAAGTFFEAVTTLDKAQIVEALRHLGLPADHRLSGDRLVSRLAAEIGATAG